MLTCAIAGVFVAPPAAADPSEQLKAAVTAVRASSCAPLRNDPIVTQAAAKINQSNDAWLDHRVRAEPESDALPLLKDLGYGGGRSAILSGAGKNQGDSIKALLLQGYAKIPDCAYRDFGVSVLQGNSAGWILSTVVLAG